MNTEAPLMPIMNPWLEEKALDAKGDEGVRVMYAPGIFVTIGALSAPRYQSVVEASQKTVRREYGKRKVPKEVIDDAFCRCLSEGALLGWDNGTKEKIGEPVFPGADGTPITYSPEEAAKVLKGLKRFMDFVVVFASDDDNFAPDPEVVQTKN